MTEKQNVALVTGSAGFIGFHVARKLLRENWRVIGIDAMTDYYDVKLKYRREAMLFQSPSYTSFHTELENSNKLRQIFSDEKPQVVIHLAAQAGVRHSIKDPRSYLNSNIIGTFELLEAARTHQPKHILMASTSSAYGATNNTKFKESDKADQQISFYAATKKATENFGHSYAHIYGLPITMFRFFTVYGPWGRPDMALFKFTKAMLSNEPIDVYNYGDMQRDFTYVEDLVNAIFLLMQNIPAIDIAESTDIEDSQSFVAPFRVVNIGNSKSERLLDFIEALECSLDRKAIKNYMPMQPGDVQSTWADTELLQKLTSYKPQTDIKTGVQRFVDWYKWYYNI